MTIRHSQSGLMLVKPRMTLGLLERLPRMNTSDIQVHQVTTSIPMRVFPGSMRRKLVQSYEESRKKRVTRKPRSIRQLRPLPAPKSGLSSWMSEAESPRDRVSSMIR